MTFLKDFSILGYRLPIEECCYGIFLLHHKNNTKRIDDYHQYLFNQFSHVVNQYFEKKLSHDVYHYITKLEYNKLLASFYMPCYQSHYEKSNLQEFFTTEIEQVFLLELIKKVSLFYCDSIDNLDASLISSQIEKYSLEQAVCNDNKIYTFPKIVKL